MSNTRILTAAHCFVEDDGELIGDFSVSVNWNSNDEEESGEFKVAARYVRIHPKYQNDNNGYDGNGYDLAIVVVEDLSYVSEHTIYYLP